MNNKWINEGGVFFPIPGNVVLHVSPGPGIFQVVQPGAPTDMRLGLLKLYDKFEFNSKFYQIGPKKLEDRIKIVWESDDFIDNKKSLGVILNGLKGSGKTWTAKQIANNMDMPVLLIDSSFDGRILNFVRDLNFSCVILIDEAEKIFKLGDEDDILLRMIDSANSNSSRHLFILTTNTLDVNPNLIGRTGRIRYLVNFRNLPEDIVKEFIEDNLKKEYESLKARIIEKVNLLEYNSIDLLKSIIDEVNITGQVDSPDEELMNIPLCRYSWDIIQFENADWAKVFEIKKFVHEHNPNNFSFSEWLKEMSDVEDDDENETEDKHGDTDESSPDGVVESASKKKHKKVSNIDILEDNFPEIYFYRRKITSRFSQIWKDCEISSGVVIQEPDKDGVFSYLDNYDKDETICVVTKQRNNINLYNKGIL